MRRKTPTETAPKNNDSTVASDNHSNIQKKSKRRFPWYFCLLFVVLIIPLCIPATYASFQSTFSGNDSVQVAAMALGGTQDVEFDVTDLAPGKYKDYTIIVTNQNEDGTRVAEVALDYSFMVSDLDNLPLTYTLSSTVTGANSNAVSAINKADGYFPVAVKCSHTYTLRVTWDSAQNDAALAQEIDLVTVTITATQRRPQI